MPDPMNPLEAARSLMQGLSWSDAFYTALAVIGVFIFYALASRRRILERSTWLAVMFWLIALVGWAFEMYMVTFTKIAKGGLLAWLCLTVAAVLLTFAIQFLTRKSRLYERIMSGSAIALIGFALVMGLVLGLILGMLLSVRRSLDQSLKEAADPARQAARRVTEI